MDEVMNKAVRVFCERGFHATSITDLAQATELTAGSLYKAFKDKRAIFLAALDHESTQRRAELMEAIDAVRTGREKLHRALMFYADMSCGTNGQRGCLVVGTAVELATFDPEIAERVVGLMKRREKLLVDLIQRGQADGSVSKAIDVKATARFLLCLFHGLRVVGKTSPKRAEMIAAVEVAMKALD
ncbi:MAG: TetR/AcrR family transcriptional regulator [Gammaproteobacteria bacterium]|nr:TetR/AcrR family transcriptional regulator [Gammaproteobacteria bacterium]